MMIYRRDVTLTLNGRQWSSAGQRTAEAVRIGIKFLTLYTFSTENWNRPSDEVATLMGLILNNLSNKLFMDNNVRLICVGDSSRMPENVLVHIRQLIEDTKNNTSMTAVLALSYSSRWEITKAVQDIAKEVQEGKLNVDDINETVLNNHMATNFMPDPELLIRTGGEKRLSNYLLWQSAYSELYFCDTYWPEFTGEDLCKAVLDYQHRERRFGKTSEQINEDCNAI